MCLLAVAPARLLAVQYAVLAAVAARSCEYRVEFGRVAAELASQGVRPPCVVTGREAVRIAVRAGCASRQAGGHDAGITPVGLVAAARERPVAVEVAGGDGPPEYTRGRRLRHLPDLRDCCAYLAPSPLPGGT